MCEFCSQGPNTDPNRDRLDPSFAGFFSPDAINAAVQLSRQRNTNGGEQEKDDGDDDESDGT